MGTLSSFIPSRLFICARKLTQILRKNNYIFRRQMFLSPRVCFRMATKRPFSTPARHANGTFLGDFFLLSLLYSRALCSLFFRHTRSKLEYKKRFCDDAMRTQRALLYRENKKRFSLSLSLLEESVFSHCSFCSFFLVSSSSLVVVVFYESVIRSKKQQIGYSFSSSSRDAT